MLPGTCCMWDEAAALEPRGGQDHVEPSVTSSRDAATAGERGRLSRHRPEESHTSPTHAPNSLHFFPSLLPSPPLRPVLTGAFDRVQTRHFTFPMFPPDTGSAQTVPPSPAGVNEPFLLVCKQTDGSNIMTMSHFCIKKSTFFSAAEKIAEQQST